MSKVRFISTFLLLVSSIAAISCRSAATRDDRGTGEASAGLSVEEQDRRALVLFQQVFDILQSSDRKSVVPKMEALYREIIDNYPKAALTQESYWRLVLTYLKDNNPPAFEKAEAAYREFVVKYPGSPFAREIEGDISDAYYRGGKWESLLKFYTPAVRQYVENGTLARPRDMFMYSEAKMNLGDRVETAKGYKIVIARFPDSRESSVAKQRLEAIEKQATKNTQ
jgi:TolA-binding protein